MRSKAQLIQELEDVILTCELAEYGLTPGDIGTVVLVHKEGKGYEVEFTTLDGETIAIVTLTADQVRPSRQREIAHARNFAVIHRMPAHGCVLLAILKTPDLSRG